MKGYVCLFVLLVGTALFAESNATPEEAAVLRVQQQWLEASQKGFTGTHFASLEARVTGNTAVVFGSMITTGDPTALRCAMVYTKRAGAWKMIAAQLVPVSETKDARGQ